MQTQQIGDRIQETGVGETSNIQHSTSNIEGTGNLPSPQSSPQRGEEEKPKALLDFKPRGISREEQCRVMGILTYALTIPKEVADVFVQFSAHVNELTVDVHFGGWKQPPRFYKGPNRKKYAAEYREADRFRYCFDNPERGQSLFFILEFLRKVQDGTISRGSHEMTGGSPVPPNPDETISRAASHSEESVAGVGVGGTNSAPATNLVEGAR